jgi:Tannase and feruloyl esterase
MSPTRKKALVAITTALLGSVLVPVSALAQESLPSCSQLPFGLSVDRFITQSVSDNEGLVSPSATIVPATSTDAAYCKVHIQFSSKFGPSDGFASGESQTIGIDIGLPLNSADGGAPSNPTGFTWDAVNGGWNGKVENLGGGGLAGVLEPVTQATNAGYVGSSSDGGHNNAQNGSDGTFAVIQATHQFDVGKITDFASESMHQQYKWALTLAKAYYGEEAKRNYWYGCSTGGREGLEVAQLFGEDFDGFLIGSPVVFWNRYDLGKTWENVVNRDLIVGAGHPAFTIDQYNNVVSHVIAACDVEGTDVVKDGVVDDPFQCKYTAETDPTVLGSPAGTCTGPLCLDLVQAQGIDKMWENLALNGAPRNHFGRRLWWGSSPTTKNPSGGIGPAISTGQLSPQMVYDWDHRDLDGDVENMYSSRQLAAANPLHKADPIALEDEIQLNQSPLPRDATPDGAPAPTGSYFQNNDYQGIIDHVHNGRKHGKIVLWSATNDHVWLEAVLGYYRATGTLLGHGKLDYDRLQTWFRYYHVPGVGHCGGDPADNPGADPIRAIAPDGNIQAFDDLVKWVEHDVAPQSAGDSTHEGILATGAVGTRPICPWPATAIYNGSGSTSEAASYHCGGNLDTRETLCKLPTTPFGRATSNELNYGELGIDPGLCEGDSNQGDNGQGRQGGNN